MGQRIEHLACPRCVCGICLSLSRWTATVELHAFFPHEVNESVQNNHKFSLVPSIQLLEWKGHNGQKGQTHQQCIRICVTPKKNQKWKLIQLYPRIPCRKLFRCRPSCLVTMFHNPDIGRHTESRLRIPGSWLMSPLTIRGRISTYPMPASAHLIRPSSWNTSDAQRA